MSIDAMKQALEALEFFADEWGFTHKSTLPVRQNAIAALRTAIEQAEKQEPVAWVCEGSLSDEKHAIDYQQEDVDAIPIGTMLYTAPPQRQPHELLCVCGASWSIDSEGNEELLSTPPQRQPLTEEEFDKIENRVYCRTREKGKPLGVYVRELCRAIERKHGIGGGE